MKMIRNVFLLVLPLLLTACPKDPVPPTPVPDGDAGHEDLDAATPATCTGWCQHALTLGCPAAQNTPNGSGCLAVCGNVQASGVVKWDLACRVKAKTCAAADACEGP